MWGVINTFWRLEPQILQLCLFTALWNLKLHSSERTRLCKKLQLSSNFSLHSRPNSKWFFRLFLLVTLQSRGGKGISPTSCVKYRTVVWYTPTKAPNSCSKRFWSVWSSSSIFLYFSLPIVMILLHPVRVANTCVIQLVPNNDCAPRRSRYTIFGETHFYIAVFTSPSAILSTDWAYCCLV